MENPFTFYYLHHHHPGSSHHHPLPQLVYEPHIFLPSPPASPLAPSVCFKCSSKSIILLLKSLHPYKKPNILTVACLALCDLSPNTTLTSSLTHLPLCLLCSSNTGLLCCFWNMPDLILLQDIYTGCFYCLKYFPPGHLHGQFLYLLQSC